MYSKTTFLSVDQIGFASDGNTTSYLKFLLCFNFFITFVDKYNPEELRKFLKKDNLIIHHARCIFVGCGGAGKTTLLWRLDGATYKELKDIQETKLADVHVNEFQVLQEEKTIKRNVFNRYKCY